MAERWDRTYLVLVKAWVKLKGNLFHDRLTINVGSHFRNISTRKNRAN